MLYPQQNTIRQRIDLSGIWQFQPDPANLGVEAGWFGGLPAARSIAVPGSWNEQHDDLFHYFGPAWYVQQVYVPRSWFWGRIFLRIGSANYAADAWINGIH